MPRRLLLIVGIPIVALVAVVAALGALVYGYNAYERRGQQAAIENSTMPVYLPGESLLAKTSFTGYRGWSNAYEIRFADGPVPGATVFAAAYQLTGDSSMQSGSEGPGDAEIAELLAARDGEGCEVVDETAQIALCTGQDTNYLKRTVDREANIQVVAIYWDNPSTNSSNNQEYNPNSTEALLLLDLQPVPKAEALDRHFNPIS